VRSTSLVHVAREGGAIDAAAGQDFAFARVIGGADHPSFSIRSTSEASAAVSASKSAGPILPRRTGWPIACFTAVSPGG
jgi:hypothetical protein